MKLDEGRLVQLASEGDLEDVRPWASVSKLVAALALAVDVEWELHDYDEPAGPDGSTLAHLLSHASGLGAEVGDPLRGVGERRVYSNVGVDRAVEHVVGDLVEAPAWVTQRVFSPLGLSAELEGRPSSGVKGSTNDLAAVAAAWMIPELVTRETRDRCVTPYLGDLVGVVPGFGRQEPCPWGLGPEVRGTKEHWMGQWPEDSFGHFGLSGALCLVNAREALAVVATSTVDFGAWAVSLWPTWVNRVRALALEH